MNNKILQESADDSILQEDLDRIQRVIFHWKS